MLRTCGFLLSLGEWRRARSRHRDRPGQTSDQVLAQVKRTGALGRVQAHQDESKLTAQPMSNPNKVTWSGLVVAVQPRIRLTRSWSERYHSYHGYVLRVQGSCAGEQGEFLVAMGKGAHEKYQFRMGMELSGQAVPVSDHRLEVAGLYKTSGLKIEKSAAEASCAGPPFLGIPPDLAIYRERGHRRLDSRTYDSRCTSCIWGCRMPVDIIVDQWNPSHEYRFETFCYGPISCPLYRAGARRRVPGRKGMILEEDDWIDHDAASHRGPDD